MNQEKFLEACKLGETQKVTACLNRGFLSKLFSPKININAIDRWGETPLCNAVKNGNIDLVRLLINKLVDISKVNNNGDSPVYIASKTGHSEIAKMLVENGADISKTDNYGTHTILYTASEHGHTEIFNMLNKKIAALVIIEILGKKSANSKVLECDDIKKIKLLIEHGANVNTTNNDGDTPLIVASEKGHSEIAKLLIENDADINCTDKNHKEPIHIASYFGHTKIVKILIENGADVNSETCDRAYNRQYTPLVFAAQGGHKKIIALLINKGAEINHCAVDTGRTPLIFSLHNDSVPANDEELKLLNDEQRKIAKIFIDKGADVLHKDRSGKSAIEYATDRGFLELVEMIEKKTNIDSTIPKEVTQKNEIKFKHIDEPNDIKLFKSYSANQLKAIVVFRVSSNNLTSPEEAQNSLQWMDMSLENQWPQNITPRQHTNIEGMNIDYRSSKIKSILEDGKYASMITCDQDFISNHTFFELENTIDGTDYFCIVIFKKQ